MVATAHPETNPTLASEALGCAWAALLSLVLLYRRSPQAATAPQTSVASLLRYLLAGAMLFGGPAVALLIHGRELDAGSLTIALALTPVIIAIAASALGTESSYGIAGRIWPGLAAVAGLLLVLVQPTLGDIRSDLALLLAPALTGIGSALFCGDRTPIQAVSASRASTALFGASTLFGLAIAETYFVAGSRPSLSLLAIASDGILALLGILTLERLGATRWSSQFTWVPLLIVIEGLVLVRPQISVYWIVGLVLLTVASVYLLLPEGAEPDSTPSTIPTVLR